MFKTRSKELERIDTGEYTTEEYELFLKDIRLVNRFAGDSWTLAKTLHAEVQRNNPAEFSILDIGAGSGELLRSTAKFARLKNLKTRLFGLELNKRSAESILEESVTYPEIKAVRANALNLPFEQNSFDYVICSLFIHHLTNDEIVKSFKEMSRVSRKKIFVIDLHRHAVAYGFYKAFCVGFRISKMVREDGSLSILRGFKSNELKKLAKNAGLMNVEVGRHFPYRLVLSGK